jgi:bifunctional non-homologous end joining protein LigD
VRTVEITHPDKVLFPDDGITKADLAGYYERVSEWMLPHIRMRPISMQRFPDGIGGKGFFHKDIPSYFPGWLKRVEVPKSGGTVTHVYACDAETLVYLVGQNTITPHIWLTRSDRPWQPDRMVIDLDPPPGSDFNAVRRAARHTGELLRELGLTPFAQVTGSKGIHVWTPLRRRAGNEEVRAFAGQLGRVLAGRHPDELTSEWRKEKRDGRILVDTARNTYAQTAVPPYSVRPRAGAPVATPIEWDELSDSKLRPDRWTVNNVLRRLSAKGDPWADIQSYARGISRARRGGESLLRWGSLRAAALLVQPAGRDRRGHLLRILAVRGAVLELDRGVLALPGEALEVVALAGPEGPLDLLVLDAGVVQRLLHLPAGMARELDPPVRTSVKSDRHVATIRLSARRWLPGSRRSARRSRSPGPSPARRR